MSHSAGGLDDIRRIFTSARGDGSDAEWAEHAASVLLLAGVDDEAVFRALAPLAEEVATYRESAESLFGRPRQWADQQLTQWREDGVDVRAADSESSLQFGVFMAALAATGFALLLFVSELISPEPLVTYSLPYVALPTLLGSAVAVVHAGYGLILRRRSFRAAAAAGALGTVVVAALLAGAIFQTKDVVLHVGSPAWLLALAGLHALVTWAVGAFWKEPPARRRHVPVSDDDAAWLREFAAALRIRGDMADAKVRELAGEARAHCVDSGRPLEEEFGPAGLHAERFVRTPSVRHRRTALLWTAGAVVTGSLAATRIVENGWRWDWPTLSGALWFALVLSFAIGQWRAYRNSV